MYLFIILMILLLLFQSHGLEQDKIVLPGLYHISQVLGIKLVATNDSHFTHASDSDMHDCLLCIQVSRGVPVLCGKYFEMW